jgi:hypothetical protein
MLLTVNQYDHLSLTLLLLCHSDNAHFNHLFLLFLSEKCVVPCCYYYVIHILLAVLILLFDLCPMYIIT